MMRGPMGCVGAMLKPVLFVGVFVVIVIGVMAFPSNRFPRRWRHDCVER